MLTQPTDAPRPQNSPLPTLPVLAADVALSEPALSHESCNEPSGPPCFVQLLRPHNNSAHASKGFGWTDGRLRKLWDYDRSLKEWVAEAAVPVRCAQDAFDAIENGARHGRHIMVLGEINSKGSTHQAKNGWLRRTKIEKTATLNQKAQPAHLNEVARRLYMVDLDPEPALIELFRLQGLDVFNDPQHAIREACQLALPELWAPGIDKPVCDLLIQLSARCGLSEQVDGHYEYDGACVRLHVFVWLSDPVLSHQFKEHAKRWDQSLVAYDFGGRVDPALYNAAQPHFISAPEFRDGSDPFPERFFRFGGEREALTLSAVEPDVTPQRRQARQTMTAQASQVAPTDYPSDWRACLALAGQPGHKFNEPIKQATFRLVGDLLRNGELSFDADPTPVLEPLIEEINSKIIAASAGSTPEKLAERLDEIRRLAYGAVAFRQAKHIAEERKREKAAQRVPTTHPDEGMEPQQAVAATRAAVEEFIKEALANRSAFQRALAHRRQPGWSFETHGLDLGGVNPPLHVLAADGGLGKSRAVIDYVLKYVDLTIWRVLVFQPDNTRCEEFAADFNDAKPEGVSEAFVIQGRRAPLCDAPDDIEGIAKQVEALGWSARKVACPKCPNREGCAYLAQFERNGPGLYLAPHVYLRTRSIPGFSRDDFVGEGTGAPILAVIIDEQFDPGYVGQKISRDALVVPFIMPDGIYGRDETEHAGRRVRDLQRRLLELLEAVTEERITNEQLVRHELDSFWTRDTGSEFLWSGEARRALGEIRCTLRDLHQACEYEAAETVRRGPMTVSKSLEAAWSLLQKLVDILSVIERGADAHDRQFLYGLRVKENTIELDWMHGLRKEFFRVPVLALDGTMSQKRAETCFTHWQGFNAQFVEPFRMQFTRIRSAHGAHATYLKVLGAPSSKGYISTIRNHVEYADDNKTVVSTTRARRDAHPEALIRALWPIIRRAGSAGLLSYKLFTDYVGNRLPNTQLGHFGAQRGRNDWENVDLLFVVGQHRAPIDVLEREAEAWSTLDAERRPIAFTGRYQSELRGLRVTDDLGGVRALAISHADAFVRMVLEQYEAEHLQALWRARSIWRTKKNPVLILDFSSECPDVTYDAVIDWSSLAAVNEFGAVLHGVGVLPEKPADTAKLAPGLFRNSQQVKELQRTGQLQTQYKTVGSAYNSNHIKGLPTLLQNAVHFNFSPDTVISGSPADHPLLRPSLAEPMVVELPRRKPMQALIDRERIRNTEDAGGVLLRRKDNAGYRRPSEPTGYSRPRTG